MVFHSLNPTPQKKIHGSSPARSIRLSALGLFGEQPVHCDWLHWGLQGVRDCHWIGHMDIICIYIYIIYIYTLYIMYIYIYTLYIHTYLYTHTSDTQKYIIYIYITYNVYIYIWNGIFILEYESSHYWDSPIVIPLGICDDWVHRNKVFFSTSQSITPCFVF